MNPSSVRTTVVGRRASRGSIQECSDSVKKMTAVEFDAFLPGRLSVSMKEGKRQIDAAARQFNQLMIPKNAI